MLFFTMSSATSRKVLLAIILRHPSITCFDAILLQSPRMPIMLNVAKMAGFIGFWQGQRESLRDLCRATIDPKKGTGERGLPRGLKWFTDDRCDFPATFVH